MERCNCQAKREITEQRYLNHRMAVARGIQKTTLTEISLEISGFPFDVKAHNRGEKDQSETSLKNFSKKSRYMYDMSQKFFLQCSAYYKTSTQRHSLINNRFLVLILSILQQQSMHSKDLFLTDIFDLIINYKFT